MPDIHIDPAVPRIPFLKEFEDAPGPCPRCGSPLHQDHQVYLVATRRGRQLADSFMLNGDFGWFCEQCPAVVIDIAQVAEMLSFTLPDWDMGDQFAIMGLIDLDAVPEDKRHLPLGDDDNPMPLVEFLEPEGRRSRRRSKRARPKRPKSRRSKKKKRRR